MSALPPIQQADLALAIPLSAIYDHFCCSICLGEIDQCSTVRECSHNFCTRCIAECLNRKHACPLCQTACGSASESLVRNTTFDRILQSIKQSKHQQSLKLVKKLLPHSPSGGGDNTATTSSSPSSDALPNSGTVLDRIDSLQKSSGSVIEEIFRAQIAAKTFLPFENVYNELKASEQRILSESSSSSSASSSAAAAALPIISSPPPVTAVVVVDGSLVPAISSPTPLPLVQPPHFPTRALRTFTRLYEQYLSELPMAPFLEPLVTTILLQPNEPPPPQSTSMYQSTVCGASGIKFRLLLSQWDDLEEISAKLIAESNRSEYPPALKIKAVNIRSREVVVNLIAASGGVTTSLPFQLNSLPDTDLHRPICEWPLKVAAANLHHHQLQPAPGGASAAPFAAVPSSSSSPVNVASPAAVSGGDASDIVLTVKGSVEFYEKRAVECFMSQFDASNPEQKVDYFKCTHCALNWICANCATSCHAGHTDSLQPFMLAHRPSYAACYCNKKKMCKLTKK